jgi:hypothetical protein
MKLGKIAATAAAAFLISAGVANATLVSGSLTVTDTGSDYGSGLSFSVTPSNPISISENLTVNKSVTDTYFTITPKSSTHTGTDDITLTFKFTNPTSATASDTGDLTFTKYFRWIYTDFSWEDGGTTDLITVNFSDGAVLKLLLTASVDCECPTQVDFTTTYTLIKDPTSVPEPMTLALLGTGLIGFGCVARRRNASA